MDPTTASTGRRPSFRNDMCFPGEQTCSAPSRGLSFCSNNRERLHQSQWVVGPGYTVLHILSFDSIVDISNLTVLLIFLI
jgi:hypothetical protein